LIGFAVLTQVPAGAQVPALQPGLRIRVEAEPDIKHKVVGTLMSKSGDTLTIATSASSWHRVHASAIRRLDVSNGESRLAGTVKGMLIGGAGFGLLTFAAVAADAKDPASIVTIVGIGGAVVGSFVGFVLRTERWERVFPERPRNETGGARRSPYGSS
jgi:hypothetical protein